MQRYAFFKAQTAFSEKAIFTLHRKFHSKCHPKCQFGTLNNCVVLKKVYLNDKKCDLLSQKLLIARDSLFRKFLHHLLRHGHTLRIAWTEFWHHHTDCRVFRSACREVSREGRDIFVEFPFRSIWFAVFQPEMGSWLFSYQIALTICDQAARVVRTETIPSNTTSYTLDLQNLKSGVYFITIKADDNISTHKVVIY